MFIELTMAGSGNRFVANTDAISCVFESSYTPTHSSQKKKCSEVYMIGSEQPSKVTNLYDNLIQVLLDANN